MQFTGFPIRSSTTRAFVSMLSLSLAPSMVTADPGADQLANPTIEDSTNDTASLEPAIATLIRQIDAIREQEEISAVGYAVVDRKGTLASGALGIRNWDSATPVNQRSMFKVGSVTKAFTGLAMLLAQEQQILSLSNRISDYQTSGFYHNPWQQQVPITLAMLLEHTAGFSDMSMAEFQNNDDSPLSLKAGLAFYPQSKRSLWRPGEHSSYSNSGPGLAAFALEQASGQAYEAFLQQNLLKPLGMSSATTLRNATVIENLVQGYDRDHRTPIPYWHIIFRPAGALNATPRDMGRFVRFLLGRGAIDGQRLLPQSAIARLENPRTTLAAKAGLSYGYGLGVYARQVNGHILYGHGGDGDGYLAQFSYSLDSGLGYFLVITAFDHGPLRKMQNLMDRFITQGLSEAIADTQFVPAPRLMQQWKGDYIEATWRFGGNANPRHMQVLIDEGRIYTSFVAGRRKELVPVAPGQFRRRDESRASTAFVMDAQVRRVIQGPMGNFIQTDSLAQDTPSMEAKSGK